VYNLIQSLIEVRSLLSYVKHTGIYVMRKRAIRLSLTLTWLTELSFKSGRHSVLLSQRKPLCRSADTCTQVTRNLSIACGVLCPFTSGVKCR